MGSKTAIQAMTSPKEGIMEATKKLLPNLSRYLSSVFTRVRAICKRETALLYRVTFLTVRFSGFLFVALDFFFLMMFLLPGGELGGRIETPGNPIGVIQ